MNNLQKTFTVALILILVLLLIKCSRTSKPEPVPTPLTDDQKFTEGLCTFAASCPAGWNDIGPVALQESDGNQEALGLPVETPPGAGFRKPRYCCKDSTASDGTAPSVINTTVGASCPTGQSLEFLVRPEDIGRTGLQPKAFQYAGWQWHQFDVCPNARLKPGDYMMGYPSCPTGWDNMGLAGMLVPIDKMNDYPGLYGSQWLGMQWRHPYICRKK